MTPEEIPEKIFTFSKHLKIENNEIVISGIVPCGDSYKGKAEAVNKLLKDTCKMYSVNNKKTKIIEATLIFGMNFVCRSHIYILRVHKIH